MMDGQVTSPVLVLGRDDKRERCGQGQSASTRALVNSSKLQTLRGGKIHLFLVKAGKRCNFPLNQLPCNHPVSEAKAADLPEGLEKSRMLVVGCRRSGLLEESVPGMGMMARLCRHCRVPTMLSSCDWLTLPSLQNNLLSATCIKSLYSSRDEQN